MRARKLAILLPPSEGKAAGGSGPPWRAGTMSLSALDPARSVVLSRLGGDVDRQPTLPAAQRYTGVLYRELGASELPATLRRRFAQQVLVVSGLWGLVSPPDPIPPYRLKMSASLPGLGKLSTWWRPTLTEALAERLAGHTVWDLLPIEHSAAWTPEAVPMARRFTVRFVTADGATVSHWNKVGKGALVRHLLEYQTTDPAQLAGHAIAGYRFDPAASTVGPGSAAIVFRGGVSGASGGAGRAIR